jgi:V/A-type H+-transporting ATPase subunit C
VIALTPFDPDWGFVCGRVSALEARLLTTEFFQTMVSHPKLEDVMRQLQDTPLREFSVTGSDFQDWSGVIDRYFHEMVMSIRKDCPNPAIANLFILRDDYQNLKIAVTGQNTYPFPSATLEPEKLAGVSAGDASHLPSPFREAATAALASVEETRNQQLIDVVLDAAYLRHVLSLSETTKAPLVRTYIEDFVLSHALVALWRRYKAGVPVKSLQRYFLPMGSLTKTLSAVFNAGDPSNWPDAVRGPMGELMRQALDGDGDDPARRFEELSTNHLVAITQRGRGQVSGPERVLTYLRTLASEAHNLKLIVCGRLSRIEPDGLKQRMRVAHG